MKIAIAQINPVVGNVKDNCSKILQFCHRAHTNGAHLAIFPELSLLGYPPKDLLLRKDFLQAQQHYLNHLAKQAPIPTIVGAALLEEQTYLYNAAILCEHTQWRVVGKKILLPNYNVFDEKRYFSAPPQDECSIITYNKTKLLLSICEDAWSTVTTYDKQHYQFDPIKNALKKNGPVDVIVNLSASPFCKSKPKIREKIFTHIARQHKTSVLVVGQVGANDQLLFDGHSMIIDTNGVITDHAKACEEDMLLFDTKAHPQTATPAQRIDDYELIIKALTMGIHDYITKCHAPGVIIGLSGGIDSAVCTTLAVKALGAKRVRAVFLPSCYSSAQSLHDARMLAKNLGIQFDAMPIDDSVQAVHNALADQTASCDEVSKDIVSQNIQARMRGLLIMALSNATNYLMLATSNKSELAVGYSTIYGDMCGAFSPIGDLYKTEIYKLAHVINQKNNLIPLSIINRPPSAELKPDQLDTDTLPSYETLDTILFNFIEQEKSASEISKITKLSTQLIDEIISKVNNSEYKRRQSPFCLMVSSKVFGDARRLPIAKQVTQLALKNQTDTAR